MPHARLEPMTLVAEGIGRDKVALFVGGQVAASNDALLSRHGIMNVLNCAVNCDINYVDETLNQEPDGNIREFGFAPFRVAKIGMVDDFGNDPILLFSAVHVLQGMLNQSFPEKNSYPLKESGNVLVHCREGRSRSLVVAALYLYRMFPDDWPNFEEALYKIRDKRGIPPEEHDEVPTLGMMSMARDVLKLFDSGRALIP